ncbi:MAG: hypothetical protein KZQ64_06875 [gamma proteobacterium symbiont of Bathyaustriella thionipta]|nr:hypothetical protein [gamma proteobacterium symbiont of Bathyaustriella thionipta]MCU7949705.1 hypothetical protein [gamma proteobacterium symbiont of Bathyaustriella thionipta]MCU7953097.1 hypothetical protein [gamma proteobacterium symbiont of Bathyaustriella thionipta]MCU7956287.1 hypothetical protein [gamma proteobacterium symbiont of Bathyaustriella thionipta]MCU7967649.1 hypothetical protein [gamma proteobacterium symbiont of Bathyaustriella thionipta]
MDKQLVRDSLPGKQIQRDNLKHIEDLTIKLNNALNNIDGATKIKLEANNLQVSGISLALQRVQIGIDKTLHDTQRKNRNHKKAEISKIS